MLLLLLLMIGGAVPRALAQYTPPEITFNPDSHTFYGPNQQVQVHICDDESVRDAATRVLLNGVQLSFSSSAGDTSCPVHKVITLNLAFASGTNTLEVKACENIAPESCGTTDATYVYTTPDPVKPTVSISPQGGSFTSASVPATLGWCDDYRLNPATTQAWLNGTALSLGSPTLNASTGGCYASATTTLGLSLQPGPNAFKAVVRDSAGNVADTARATFTYAPVVSKVGEDRVRRPGLCALSCFDATLQYASHTITAMDVARSVTLAYSSAHAEPRGMVQLDVEIGNGPVPGKIGITLFNGAGAAVPLFGTTQTSAWYTGAAGTNRVSAWFDASTLATGTYAYVAQLARDYGNNNIRYDSVNVRVIVVNEAASPYGAGWSVLQDARLVLPGSGMDPGGVTVVTGDGTAVFFTAPASCASTVTCTYVSPPSEFSTLNRFDWGYTLVSPGADSVGFTPQGKIAWKSDRFGTRTYYYYYTTPCDWCIPGMLASIVPPGPEGFYFGYNTARNKLSSIYIRGTWLNAPVDADGMLRTIYDGDNVQGLAATYSGGRLTGYTDRAGNHTDLTYDAWGKVASIIGPAYRAQGSSAYRDTTRFTSYEKAVLPAAGTAPSTAPAAAVSPLTAYAYVTDGRNRSTRLRLDGWRAADQVRDPLGYTSGSARNADGLTTLVQDARGNTVTYAWNGRLLQQVTDPDGTVLYDYDSNGRVTRAYGNTPETQYFYSASPRWVVDSVKVAGEGTTRFTYDARGRLTSQSDSAGHTTTIQYDTTTAWINT